MYLDDLRPLKSKKIAVTVGLRVPRRFSAASCPNPSHKIYTHENKALDHPALDRVC
jgi:hypothetical protein